MLPLKKIPRSSVPTITQSALAAGEEKEQNDTRDAAVNIIMDALKQLDDLVHRRQLGRQLEWHWIGSYGELMPIGARWH